MKIEVLKINKINKSSFLSKNKREILLVLFIFFVSFLFILNSGKYIPVVLDGIILFGTKVLPSLLPFFFVTKLLSNFESLYIFCSKFKLLTKLFNTPAISFYIFFMSVISGYPVGAKLTGEFYERGIISQNDAKKILSFCSTSGPLFVIGSVGIGFFHSQKIGILLFISHILASVINGIIFRGKKNETKEKKIDFNSNLSLDECMYNSIRSVLVVSGFIVVFYVLIQILLDYNILYLPVKLFEIFGLSKLEATGLCAGLIEITKGASILSQCENIKTAFLLTSFIISFSGLSIFAQSFTFLEKLKINKKLFFLQKITHALLTLGVSYLFVLFF